MRFIALIAGLAAGVSVLSILPARAAITPGVIAPAPAPVASQAEVQPVYYWYHHRRYYHRRWVVYRRGYHRGYWRYY